MSGERLSASGSLVHVAVVIDPIDVADLETSVLTSQIGAMVNFIGCVRDHDHGRLVTALEYEAHPSAAGILGELAVNVTVRFPGTRIAVMHRVGQLGIGDTALAVVVGAAHRREAFEACATLVEEIKQHLPIWKLQTFDD
ncbi:MAG: molybdenum cofactor biosynthesis protein MoaE, partial [Candidatus Nanopelagicales bacterium]